MKSSKENRRAPRKKHNSVLELLDPKTHRIQSITRLVDVSTVGLCFSSPHEYKVGVKLSGRLRLLKEGVLVIQGHVVWVRRASNVYLCGLAFDSVRGQKKA